MNLESFIRDIPDFPKPGIVYKDITPLLLNPAATKSAVASFAAHLKGQPIDKVVGVESRGFFFATLLASALGAGFVPVRKPGKLPYETIGAAYVLEYGEDQLEMHKDAIRPGERVLLHDDVLATGGTAEAACRLITSQGGEIIQCNFLIELEFLEGRKKLSPYQVVSLLRY